MIEFENLSSNVTFGDISANYPLYTTFQHEKLPSRNNPDWQFFFERRK
jgi:hypothetical protein